MRQTRKLLVARATLKGILSSAESFPDDEVYGALERRGWWWDSDSQTWKDVSPPSTSIFKDDEGNPTGLLRVRLMGMAQDAEAFLKIFKLEGWSLIEKSDPYPNRKGPGYRWYLTFKKDGA